MSYQTALTIEQVINEIHTKKYLLPSIQREFKWEPYQIERLFDSIMRDYPISSFLFWQVEKSQVMNFEFYEFLRDFHERDKRHNPKANINGENEIIGVLDGQQRLTSFYIGLKGSYAYKIAKKRWDNPHAYPMRKLFLNILKSPDKPEFEYEFTFLTEQEAKQNDNDHFWFEVGHILNLKEPGDVNTYLIDNEIFSNFKGDKANFANKTLFKLRNVIFEKQTVSYYLEKGEKLDKVLNIFIRINSGGTVLSYSDLLLSIASAQWKEKDAREEILNFVDEVNRIGEGFNISKDFVLKTCLVLSDFTDIAFKVDNFNKSNMLQIEQNWDNISKAIRLALNLVSSFGYNRESLTSNNALIPIAYYLYKKDLPIHFHTSDHTKDDRKLIKKWLILSLLKQAFGGHPDNILRPIREILCETNEQFPLNKIIDKFRGSNKTLIFTDEDIENLTQLNYGNGYTFSVLSILYPSFDFRNVFHTDHIFPKSLFTEVRLKKRNIPADTIDEYLTKYNLLSNLQLLEAIPNIEKQDKDFEVWLESNYKNQDDFKDYKDKHFIPDCNLSIDNFLDFYDRRKAKIKSQLSIILKIDNETDDING